MSKNMLSVKERLLSAAAELFYDHGINATGIDSITAKAGVAKKSLYNNFTSKADLIAQYLEIRHAEWLTLYYARLELAISAQDKILAIFLAYIDHAEKAYECGFRGCGLLNAAAELPAKSAGRAIVNKHKQEVEQLFVLHLNDYLTGDHQQAELLAKHFSFLLEGAMARAGLEGNSNCLWQAQNIAISILQQS